MKKLYLVAYDIANNKRLYRARKIISQYALDGQKSCFEVYVSYKTIKKLEAQLLKILNPLEDRVNIVKINKDPIILGDKYHLDISQKVIIL